MIAGTLARCRPLQAIGLGPKLGRSVAGANAAASGRRDEGRSMRQAGKQPSPVVADQGEVIAFLSSHAAHGQDGPARVVETQGAVVVLAGDVAIKMKRAVRFPFMDFSTLDKRRAACEAELAVNAPNAPGLYLKVQRVTREPSGLALDGPGETVEWVVRMRRFDETRTLDHLADAGALPDRLLADLVEAIRAAHARAPERRGADVASSLALYVEQNREALLAAPGVVPAIAVNDLTERSRQAIEQLRPLLAVRSARGLVRRCHGDLHLRNIALVEGRPVLFDAIEFDEDIATCDVLYDVAFLLMDLWHHGLRAEANRVLNRMLWASAPADLDGLAAMPFFLSRRAALRAKIEAAEADIEEAAAASAHVEAARAYVSLALAALDPVRPRLVAVGGLSGTGKSTLAAALSPLLGGPPGAVHLRSDAERKRIAGIPESGRLPAQAYTQKASDAVYAALLEKARLALRAGRPVVMDAVFARSRERQDAADLASRCGTGFDGLWLEAPIEVLASRVAARTGDASDADEAVVRRQAGFDIGPLDWTHLASAGPVGEVLALARTALGVT